MSPGNGDKTTVDPLYIGLTQLCHRAVDLGA
jgi:hypothetical protein